MSQAGLLDAGQLPPGQGHPVPGGAAARRRGAGRAVRARGHVRHALPLAAGLPPRARAGGRARSVASRYLPGELWPVNPATVRNRDALFCLNERLVTVLDTALRPLRGGEGGRHLRGTHPRRLRRPADPRRAARGAPDVPAAEAGGSAATSWAASRWAPRSSSSSSRAGWSGTTGWWPGRPSAWASGSEARREPAHLRGEGDERPPPAGHRGLARAGGRGPRDVPPLRLRARRAPRWSRTPRSSCAASARPPTSWARRCTPSRTRRAGACPCAPRGPRRWCAPTSSTRWPSASR